eukprot:485478_1
MMCIRSVIYFYVIVYITSCMEFPVLDLSQPASELVIAFENALKTYGFFYIKHHGISTDILHKVFNESKHFYGQSLEFKNKYSYNNNRGYIKLDNKTGQIGFDGLQKIPDQKEGFVLMWPEYNINKPFYGSNQWPEMTDVNSNYYINRFKYIFEQYKYEMDNLNMKLIQIFALSLGLSEDYFFNGDNMLFVADQLLEIALWHYMPLQSDIKNGIYACGEHSDWNLFSILAIDDCQGLQIRFGGNWYNIEYKENLLIVNSGNMVKVMTNGYYKSSYHRVLLNEAIDRYSIVYFISPNYEWKLKCIGKMCNQQSTWNETYEQDINVNSGQYLAKMFAAHTTGYELKSDQ